MDQPRLALEVSEETSLSAGVGKILDSPCFINSRDRQRQGISTKLANIDSLKIGVVPEPASLALMGLGGLLAGCGVVRRRKNQISELAS